VTLDCGSKLGGRGRAYNRQVSQPLARDTPLEMEHHQIEIWRSLSAMQVAEIVAGASDAARQLALAGLRTQYPQASERELVIRYARLTLGEELARKVYPDWATLQP
jgi:hypothetical protein